MGPHTQAISGCGPQRLQIKLKECSSWNEDLQIYFDLDSPSDVQYHLEVRRLSLVDGTHAMKGSFYDVREDIRGQDDSIWYDIEVRYAGSNGVAWMDQHWVLYVSNHYP
jgi:hypothetical protein